MEQKHAKHFGEGKIFIGNEKLNITKTNACSCGGVLRFWRGGSSWGRGGELVGDVGSLTNLGPSLQIWVTILGPSLINMLNMLWWRSIAIFEGGIINGRRTRLVGSLTCCECIAESGFRGLPLASESVAQDEGDGNQREPERLNAAIPNPRISSRL